MIDKLEEIEARFEVLSEELTDTTLFAQPEKYKETARAHSDLGQIVEEYHRFKAISETMIETETLLAEEGDADLLEMAREELSDLQKQHSASEEQLKRLLLPKDPNDEKAVILEIRAGTGGAEATLFAQEALRMYSRYALSLIHI